MMTVLSKISACLWFEANAEAAVEFYISIFPNSRVTRVTRWGEGGLGPQGSVVSVTFELAGQEFLALNGNTQSTFTEAISLLIACESQEEVDVLWSKLLDGGGKPTACGWLVDRFGVSWQVVPSGVMELLSDPDPKKVGRVFQALMGMQKLDLASLQRAHAGA